MDAPGNLIYDRDTSCDTTSVVIKGDKAYISGKWYNFMESYDYDSNSNKIHTLCRNGSEYWFEYDSNGTRSIRRV